MMNNKKLLCIIVLFIFSLNSNAQELINGIISDGSGLPISHATIEIKDSNVKTETDENGAFQINAKKNAILLISAQGMKSKELKVTDDNLFVTLISANETLAEVMVTGAFGIKKSKASQGYSTQTVGGDDITEGNRSNFANALQGRIAGMTVTSTSGAPGASATIQLRGVNSISGSNSPLYVVDGLPISNETLNQSLLVSGQDNKQTDFTNRGADINPDDIETITVLKGPEAAALYGIKAGNGAIIITTKKGKKGEGRITYSNNIRFEEVYRFPKVQEIYDRGSQGITSTRTRLFFGDKYTNPQRYDNFNAFMKTGFSFQNNLTYETGTDKTTYRLSFANLDQTGTVPNTGYKRLNASIYATAKINDNLKSEASFAYTKSSNQKATKGLDGLFNSVLAFPINRDMTNYLNVDGTRKKLLDSDITNEWDNPFWNVNKNLSEDFNNRSMINLALIYDPLKWLNITGRVGFDISATNGYSITHPSSNLGISKGGVMEIYDDSFNNTSTTLLVTAKHSIGKFNGRLLLGNATDYKDRKVHSTTGNKFMEPDFNSINNTNPTTQRSNLNRMREGLIGFFGEFSLDYDKIAYLNITGRKDYASTLPKGRNDFFYPSFAGSFVFSKLSFLQDNKILSFGKLRASYASVANIPDPYTIYPKFESKPTTGGGYGYGFSSGNPNIKPELRISYEFGTELKFLNNRLGLDIAWYHSQTDDPIITGVRTSYGSGFILSNMNFGSIKNTGWEIMFTAVPIKKENFTWDIFTNFTKTKSELLSLPPNLKEYYNSDTWIVNNSRGGAFVGGPLTTLTGASYLKNDAGDILIDPAKGLPIRDSKFAVIGDRNPDFIMGIGNSFNYKNFGFSFLFDIRKGGDILNGTEYFAYVNGLSTRSVDREKPVTINGVLRDGLENTANPTRNNIQIIPKYQNEYYTDAPESEFIEKDINWLKLKEIVLSYKLGANVMDKIKYIKSLSFNFSVTDVFIITNYTGADPSVNASNASIGGYGGLGVDYGVFSTPRAFNFGVKMGL